jgi:hypothetical protein
MKSLLITSVVLMLVAGAAGTKDFALDLKHGTSLDYKHNPNANKNDYETGKRVATMHWFSSAEIKKVMPVIQEAVTGIEKIPLEVGDFSRGEPIGYSDLPGFMDLNTLPVPTDSTVVIENNLTPEDSGAVKN